MTDALSSDDDKILESLDMTELLSASQDCADHMSVCTLQQDRNALFVRSKRSVDLSKSDQVIIFRILEENMKSWYTKNWGWKEIEKKKELFHPNSRFLCVYKRPSSVDCDTTLKDLNLSCSAAPIMQISDELIGFTMFRFEWDDEDEPEHPVLFCYEIQMCKDHRGQSIGSHVRTSPIPAE